MPMSEPRRSFYFFPPEISASFHAGVITPSSFFSPSPFRVGYSFSSFPFSRSFSFSRATFGLVSYVELVCSLHAARGVDERDR